MATKAERLHMHDLMTFLRAHRAQLDYPLHDVRGHSDDETWKLDEKELRQRIISGGRIMLDCSQFATQICRWAGLADPNGLKYSHCGYTGTMLNHLTHYTDPAKAGIGALVVYGPGTGEHVSMVYEPGVDPLLCSHGRSGLDLVRLSQQRMWHHAPVTLCSIAKL